MYNFFHNHNAGSKNIMIVDCEWQAWSHDSVSVQNHGIYQPDALPPILSIGQPVDIRDRRKFIISKRCLLHPTQK